MCGGGGAFAFVYVPALVYDPWCVCDCLYMRSNACAHVFVCVFMCAVGPKWLAVGHSTICYAHSFYCISFGGVSFRLRNVSNVRRSNEWKVKRMEGQTNGRSNEWKVKRQKVKRMEGQTNGRSSEWTVKRPKVKHRGPEDFMRNGCKHTKMKVLTFSQEIMKKNQQV